jgi:hypothetical protein
MIRNQLISTYPVLSRYGLVPSSSFDRSFDIAPGFSHFLILFVILLFHGVIALLDHQVNGLGAAPESAVVQIRLEDFLELRTVVQLFASEEHSLCANRWLVGVL